MAGLVRNNKGEVGTDVTSLTEVSYDSELDVVRPKKVLQVAVSVKSAATAPTVDDVTFNSVSLTKAVGTISASGTTRAEIWRAIS